MATTAKPPIYIERGKKSNKMVISSFHVQVGQLPRARDTIYRHLNHTDLKEDINEELTAFLI